MTQISAIITGHREKLLAGPSIASFEEAVAGARRAGLEVETIMVLDRPDDLTRQMFEAVAERGHRLVITDGGDPGLTRNRGIAESGGDYVSFLDADDLWSFNWLIAAFQFCAGGSAKVVAHSELNVIFGTVRQIWFHADSAATDFEVDYQRVGNLWDAMSFGPRRIYEQFPFHKNALADGYGHEDWHWNNVTLEAGIQHRPVPGTVHMKRRRPGSQMAKCDEIGVIVYPSGLTRYDWDAKRPDRPAPAE